MSANSEYPESIEDFPERKPALNQQQGRRRHYSESNGGSGERESFTLIAQHMTLLLSK
jgi:hypothetical protein